MLMYNCSLIPNKTLQKPVVLGPSDTLKVLLMVKEDHKAKQPHQAFLQIKDPATNLDTSYPLSVKDSGKGKVELVGFPLSNSTRISDTLESDTERPPLSTLDLIQATIGFSYYCIIWFLKALL